MVVTVEGRLMYSSRQKRAIVVPFQRSVQPSSPPTNDCHVTVRLKLNEVRTLGHEPKKKKIKPRQHRKKIDFLNSTIKELLNQKCKRAEARLPEGEEGFPAAHTPRLCEGEGEERLSVVPCCSPDQAHLRYSDGLPMSGGQDQLRGCPSKRNSSIYTKHFSR
jgi:hypothetical protein